MRKLLLLLLTLSCTFASMMTLRGSFGGNVAIDGKSPNYAVHGQVMHFIPILPNMRLEKSKNKFKNDLEAIFFYNLLDETFFLSLDLGLGINLKKISSIKYDKKLPLLFVGVKTDLPFSNLSLKAKAIAMQKSKDVGHKAEIMLEYKAIDNLFIDVVLDVGYRDEYFSTIEKNNKKETVFFELNFTI